MSVSFPRFAEAARMLIRGRLWNRLVGEVEKQGRLSVAAPLGMHQDSSGNTIYISPVWTQVEVFRITGAAGGAGKYNARTQVQSTNADDRTSALAVSGLYDDLYTSDDVLIENLAEDGVSGHVLTVDGTLYVIARRTARFTSDSPPRGVVEIPAGGAAAKPALFAVNITQIGGADSVGGGLPTWTYNVFDINDGTQLNTPGTPLAPETALRIAGFSGSPGDKGTCRHKPDGTLVLFWANEVPNWLQCGG